MLKDVRVYRVQGGPSKIGPLRIQDRYRICWLKCPKGNGGYLVFTGPALLYCEDMVDFKHSGYVVEFTEINKRGQCINSSFYLLEVPVFRVTSFQMNSLDQVFRKLTELLKSTGLFDTGDIIHKLIFIIYL